MFSKRKILHIQTDGRTRLFLYNHPPSSKLCLQGFNKGYNCFKMPDEDICTCIYFKITEIFSKKSTTRSNNINTFGDVASLSLIKSCSSTSSFLKMESLAIFHVWLFDNIENLWSRSVDYNMQVLSTYTHFVFKLLL